MSPEFLPGVFPSMSMGEYHALDAASNSRLNALRRSPAHLQKYLTEPSKDTLALKIGRAVHTAILEPDYFHQNFVIPTQCEAVTEKKTQCKNPGILYRAETGWLCGVHGRGLSSDESRIPLSTDAYATCLQARDSVHKHPIASKLIAGMTDVELSIVWDDPETSVRCKARFDGYVPNLQGGVILDIKTCTDASVREFERAIFSRGYDLQGAHYLAGADAVDMPAAHFCHIAVEKEVAVAAVYRLKDEVIDAGRARLVQLQRLYKKCMESGEFPGYSDEIVDIGIPEWSWRQLDSELAQTA